MDAARADIARLTAAPAARLVIGVSPLAMTARLAEALAGVRCRRRVLDDLSGVHAVPLSAPRLVHRTEALHKEMPDGPAALLAAALTA